MTKLSLKSKLVATCVLIALGLVTLMVIMAVSTERIKVTGPIYQDIVQGKDLIADILPPPEYILESYLVVLQAGREKSSEKAPQYLERLKKLRAEYEDRHAYWIKELHDGKIKSLLLEQSYVPAVTFFDAAERSYFPALISDNHDQADKVLIEVLAPSYESHRKVIDEIVTLTTAQNAEIEKNAISVLSKSNTLVITIGAVFLACILAVFSFFTRNITGQLGGDPSYVAEIARQVADGDLSINVHVNGGSHSVLGGMKDMVNGLREIVLEVSHSAENIDSASTQLHSSAEHIATGNQEVASQASTVATAGEEISATSRDIAHNCLLRVAREH